MAEARLPEHNAMKGRENERMKVCLFIIVREKNSSFALLYTRNRHHVQKAHIYASVRKEYKKKNRQGIFLFWKK
jgi:hypothetical protein